MQRIVISDLDGTLLDRVTYSWAAARPALAALREHHLPLVLASSKTRTEIVSVRAAMANHHPFLCENGGALVFDDGREIVLGTPRREVAATLQLTAREARIAITPWSTLSLAEIATLTGLHEDSARRAMQREFGEPFLIRDEGRALELIQLLWARGITVVEGGRFHHASRGCDKAIALRRLLAELGEIDSVALGDAPNDAAMLCEAKTAIIMPSSHLDVMRTLLPHAFVAAEPGPAGWNAIVLEWLDGQLR